MSFTPTQKGFSRTRDFVQGQEEDRNRSILSLWEDFNRSITQPLGKSAVLQSSLRGKISATTTTLSQSTLLLLDNKAHYSRF